MSVVLDSYALLGAIGSNPAVFDDIDVQVHKQAGSLLKAQLKQKGLNLEKFQAILVVVREKEFELFLDTVDDKFLKSLAKKLDPNSGLVKAGQPDELRNHLMCLGVGKVTLTEKPAKKTGGKKKAPSPARKVPVSRSSKSHAITAKPPRR